MGALLVRVLNHTPAVVETQALTILFRATGSAFQGRTPRFTGLSRQERLLAYAWLTAEWAEDVLRRERDVSLVRERLYRNGYRLGRTAGWLLRVRGVGDVMSLAHFLYGMLEIELSGAADGGITIPRCYFSSFYSPPVCELMSALDRGIFAGLAGGGDLVFTERITEGRPCCRARFSMEDPR